MKKLIPLLLCCLLLVGCIFPGPPVETEPTAPATDSKTEPAVTVTIYYGNENADGFEAAEVLVEEVNMNVLVEQLITHGVLPENVHIGSMQFDGTCLNLNFSPSFADFICTMGTSGEYIVVGSVVNTFLTAYPDYETVSIKAGGQILESGHMVYDEPMGFYD